MRIRASASPSWARLVPFAPTRHLTKYLVRPYAPGETTSASREGLETAVAQGAGRSARSVIERYYAAYNAGDLDTIAGLLSEDCSYHDMIYEEPFRGRTAVLEYLGKVRSIVPGDLRFIIEDATEGDPNKVGIIWHVECGEGVVFPFSRGCSFYSLNRDGEITVARDLVESALKPGSFSLRLLAAVTPLVRMLGPGGSAGLRKLPLASAGLWAFYAAYTAYVMLSTAAPGLPAWRTPPEALQEVLHLSLNFFYINIGLNAAGVALVPSVPSHPVYEALFNFINAWSMMALPVILADARCRKVRNKAAWWTGIMLLTNVFFIPFMALRAAPDPDHHEPSASPSLSPSVPALSSPASPSALPSPLPRASALPPSTSVLFPPTSTSGRRPGGASCSPPSRPASSLLPEWSPLLGSVGLAVGLFSIAWALVARPEYGDLTARLAYFQHMLGSDRVFFAFVVDAGLYSVWQALLLEGAPGGSRFVPFFGLVAHLLSSRQKRPQS